MDKKFKVGDVVYLKSDHAIAMTVERTANVETRCVWLGYKNNLEAYTFPNDCLNSKEDRYKAIEEEVKLNVNKI